MINKNIQIMRGISLLMVFFFHLEISYFKFGYLGVDFFFLISGYLMPIIIPKYTPYTYIKARVKRLYPALSFAVLVSLAAGFFILMPGEYKSLSESSISSLLFSSNYYFLYNTGYFDVDSKLQFLLHTWTLGNEFLGYILIFLIWLAFGGKKLLPAAYLLCILSLLYILYRGDAVQYLDPIPRLYLFFFAFIVSSRCKNMSFEGFSLPLISIFTASIIVYFFGDDIVDSNWPNKSILFFPALILPLLMMKVSIVPSFVKPAFMKIGDWSYSIYLWHWLIISIEFSFLRNTVVGSATEAIILFIPGVFFGVLSYYFIERNIKFCYLTTALSLVMALFIYSYNGVESRVDSDVVKYSNIYKMTGVDYVGGVDFDGLGVSVFQHEESNVNSILVIGDSFSQHILPIMKETSAFHNSNIYRYASQPDNAVDNWEKINEFISKFEINDLIVSYRVSTKGYDEIKRLVGLLNGNVNYNVTVIRDIPSVEDDPVSCYIKKHSSLMFLGCGFDIENGIPISKVSNKENENWEYIKNNRSKYRVIDTHESMCDEDVCVTFVNGEFIMRDKSHFNEKLSKETNKYLGSVIFTSN